MDYIRSKLFHATSSTSTSTTSNNFGGGGGGGRRKDGNAIIIKPGQVEEVIHTVPYPGTINLSSLRFWAYPADDTNYDDYTNDDDNDNPDINPDLISKTTSNNKSSLSLSPVSSSSGDRNDEQQQEQEQNRNLNQDQDQQHRFIDSFPYSKEEEQQEQHDNQNQNQEHQDQQSSRRRQQHRTIHSYIDIVVFEVPKHCSSSQACDLSKYGIGRIEENFVNGMEYLSLCDDITGRLYIEKQKFRGYKTQLYIPPAGLLMKDRILDLNAAQIPVYPSNDESKLEIIIANCDKHAYGYGRNVELTGQVVFDADNPFFGDGHTSQSPLDTISQIKLITFGLSICIFFSLFSFRVRTGTRAEYILSRVNRNRISNMNSNSNISNNVSGNNTNNNNRSRTNDLEIV